MLRPDVPLNERLLWAGLAAIVALAHDGPELGTDQRFFQRIQAACRSFGVHGPDEDRLLRSLGFYYHRASDCYVSKEEWELMTLQDARHFLGMPVH
jgi:hypothetical protein